jgi:hypothetical protein
METEILSGPVFHVEQAELKNGAKKLDTVSMTTEKPIKKLSMLIDAHREPRLAVKVGGLHDTTC